MSRTEAPKYEDLPTGTTVLAFPGSREGRAILTTTRSEPWTLPSGERVVAVNGYAGGIALTHIEVMPTPDAEVLADLIAPHDGYRVNGDGWTVCLCGHVAVGDDDDGSHARHVADAIARVIPPVVGQS